MLKKILIGLSVIVLILAVVIAMQPSEFQISRSELIPASPRTVFEHVNDLHRWDAWSPWAKLDPAAEKTFSGPSAGVGSSFRWSGNKEIGEGAMTITESRSPEFIRLRLTFVRPFAATNEALFTFLPEVSGTRVTWSMSGPVNTTAKLARIFIDVDQMLAEQFARGLTDLQSVAAPK